MGCWRSNLVCHRRVQGSCEEKASWVNLWLMTASMRCGWGNRPKQVGLALWLDHLCSPPRSQSCSMVCRCCLKIIIILIYFNIFLACGILVPWPGIEPMPPALAAWSLNHWSTREFPCLKIINNFLNKGAQHFYFALECANYTAGLVDERRD